MEGHACCSVVEEILRCAHAEHLVVLRLQFRHCLNRGRIACVDGEFLAVRLPYVVYCTISLPVAVGVIAGEMSQSSATLLEE